MNLAILVGRIAHTPELKALPSGQKVANMSLATNYYYTKESGEKVEGTDYHNITAYGKTAETMATYLKGGDQIIVHGSMKTRSWEVEGEKSKRYRTEVIVDRFEFGAKNMKREDRQGDDQSQPDEHDGQDAPSDDINAEDIPF